MSELSGRSVQYGYDDIYRLTSETIAGATSHNGMIGYTYDAVGNRQQILSTVEGIPTSGTLFYDANDRTATDNYDNNGNTISSGGDANVYDFENHMVQHGAVTIVYDGDGNRVSEAASGTTTNYLVDTLNPTGYAQVVDELQSGLVTRSYTYGLQMIDERQPVAGSWKLSFYGYDGHGSVRYLTDSTGTVTDTYDYDAFGNLLVSTRTTQNNYRFAGEQWDPNLGLYYNRARYLDVRSGRFWAMDTWEGIPGDPSMLVAIVGHDVVAFGVRLGAFCIRLRAASGKGALHHNRRSLRNAGHRSVLMSHKKVELVQYPRRKYLAVVDIHLVLNIEHVLFQLQEERCLLRPGSCANFPRRNTRSRTGRLLRCRGRFTIRLAPRDMYLNALVQSGQVAIDRRSSRIPAHTSNHGVVCRYK